MFALLFASLLFCNVFLPLEEAINLLKLNKMFLETQCSDEYRVYPGKQKALDGNVRSVSLLEGGTGACFPGKC